MPCNCTGSSTTTKNVSARAITVWATWGSFQLMTLRVFPLLGCLTVEVSVKLQKAACFFQRQEEEEEEKEGALSLFPVMRVAESRLGGWEGCE